MRKKKYSNPPKKKSPAKTLFGKYIENSPEAHRLSVALAMGGLNTDIPTAHLILRIFTEMNKMGGKFDLSTASKIQTQTLDEYNTILEKHEEEKKKVR